MSRPITRVLTEGAIVGSFLAVVGLGVTYGMGRLNANQYLLSDTGIRSWTLGGAPVVSVGASYFAAGMLMHVLYEGMGVNEQFCKSAAY